MSPEEDKVTITRYSIGEGGGYAFDKLEHNQADDMGPSWWAWVLGNHNVHGLIGCKVWSKGDSEGVNDVG